MIIDATDLIVGRIATVAAKAALLGQDVIIINCGQAKITGDKKMVLAKYQRKRSMGTPSTGPFFPRNPDMFMKRAIRGMLPYKQPKGRDALKRIKCYVTQPEDMKGKASTIKEANVSKVPSLKHTTVKEICTLLGGKQ